MARYIPKVRLEYATATEIGQKTGPRRVLFCTERCDSPDNGRIWGTFVRRRHALAERQRVDSGTHL
jgi:hypothetical protein